MSDNMTKLLIAIGVILWVVSPIDACPGPIDDLLVAAIGFAASRRLSE